MINSQNFIIINKLNIIINNQNDIIKSLTPNVNDLNSYISITSTNIIDKILISVDKTISELISTSIISIHKKDGVQMLLLYIILMNRKILIFRVEIYMIVTKLTLIT